MEFFFDMNISKLYNLFKEYPSISTDSRNIKKDSIFFALKGENFNGNKFAKEALKSGCKYAVIDEKEYEEAYDRVHSQYEETVKIKNVYNRFVLFPGTTHHGVQTYGTRDRLTLNFFGMGQYGSLNPLMRMR